MGSGLGAAGVMHTLTAIPVIVWPDFSVMQSMPTAVTFPMRPPTRQYGRTSAEGRPMAHLEEVAALRQTIPLTRSTRSATGFQRGDQLTPRLDRHPIPVGLPPAGWSPAAMACASAAAVSLSFAARRNCSVSREAQFTW